MTQTVSVLVPIEITDAMVTACSLSEPDVSQGEVAWSAATKYATGDFIVRSTTHSIYACIKDESAARSQLPEADPFYWEQWKPSNRFAPFDGTADTQAVATASLNYTVVPGFFNAICFYGLRGGTLTVTVKDAPGGTIIFGPTVYNIQQVPFDEYDYCWGQITQLDRLVVPGLVPYPSAEVTIAIAGGVADTVGVGTMAFGDLCSLVPQDATWAGPDYNAKAKPTTFGGIAVLSDGTTKWTNQRKATDLTMTLRTPKNGGDIALAILQRVIGVPACWIGTDVVSGLNTFGIASADVAYQAAGDVVSLDVRGLA